MSDRWQTGDNSWCHSDGEYYEERKAYIFDLGDRYLSVRDAYHKKTTVISGQENTVSHVTAPKDIPAVAVEINKSSEVICDKLSEITYTAYTDSDTLHIPVQWNVAAVNWKRYCTGSYAGGCCAGTEVCSWEWNWDELSNSFSGTKICDFEDTPLRIDLFGGECFFCAGGFRMAGKMV